ncbi:murein biosynthesis integral membrane protein MurJ [Prochlorococcus sp. AH-716-O13]|nr:murein biosynthesis integral membrane protein MurJ [Prochlorococcus sp. AH-716-O13]
MHSYFKNNVASISFATSLSKVAGFIRQIFIAAAFGIGITYDAYNYAYIIPGFLLIIIGGINGPLHNAVVAVLTPLKRREGGLVLTKVSIKLTLLFFILGVVVFFNSSFLINFLAPNLNFEAKTIATNQLRILTPCIPLSAFIGLSFGALNSRNKFFVSSISPALTSLTTILFISANWLFGHQNTNYLFYSGILAKATLTGTCIQFATQCWAINKIGLFRFNSAWHLFKHEEKRIFKLIAPATISSGLGQINVFVDMFFASSFQGAASGLAYGNFLIQAPLGVLSNALILPLLPKFSKFNSNQENRNLEKSLISGIEYCFLTTIFLTGFFITFNNQIVQFVFQRGAFNSEAVFLVKNILIAYAVGIPFYLYRDLLVRTYYAIEIPKLPFQLSFAGIILNVFFDWFLVGAPTINFGNLSPYNFGVIGIILSSGLVNLIICIFLTTNFNTFGINIPKTILLKKFVLISLACFITSTICYSLIKDINGLNSNIWELFILVAVLLAFLIIYFSITKLFGVNRLNLHIKI